MTETHSGPPRGRLGRTLSRARRASLAAGSALALAATGCLQDSAATGPATGAARLALTATVAGGANGSTASAVTALAVRVVYLRDTGESGVLLERQIPLSGVSAGSTLREPLALDLGPCLADPRHLPGADSCRVLVRVTLVAGSAALDVVTIGPLDLRPGENASPAEVTLHTVGTLAVAPGVPAPLLTGQGLQLTATLSDKAGGVVSDREISWSTDAPGVATVDAAGRVTTVGPGTATITASGGGRTTTVLVTVRAPALIKLEKPDVSFEAMGTGSIPERQSVAVVNGTTGTLDGLAVGTIAYDGDVTGWLTATLSGGTAPATLYLRPSRTDLAPGSYTATVPLTAPAAENGGSVRVSYTVRTGSIIVLDRSLIQYNDSVAESQITVGVSASGPVGGLTADVSFGPYGGGWLTASLTAGRTPADLLVSISGELFPGVYQANVWVTSPEAANRALLQVVRTVSSDDYDFYASAYPGCIFVGDSIHHADSDTVGVYAGLYHSQYGYMDSVPVTFRTLGPGLTLLANSGVTGGPDVLAVRTKGFLGVARIEATLGLPPHQPGALADTLEVRVHDSPGDYYYCGGAGSRAPYAPGAPSFRRAPAGLPARPAPRPASEPAFSPPRVRRTAPASAPPASAPPASTVRSRLTPEKH